MARIPLLTAFLVLCMGLPLPSTVARHAPAFPLRTASASDPEAEADLNLVSNLDADAETDANTDTDKEPDADTSINADTHTDAALEALAAYLRLTLKAYSRGDADEAWRVALSFPDYTDGDPVWILRVAQSIPLDVLAEPLQGLERLRALVDDATLSPAARDVAAELLTVRLEASGALDEARAVERARGIIPAWWLLGPFGERGAGDFYAPFPPETEIDPDATLTAFGRPATWQVLPELEVLPRVRPWEWTSPARGVVYLFTQVHVEEATRAHLELDTTSAHSVRVNGAVVSFLDRFRLESPRTYAVPVSLQAGWNRILLKVSHDGEDTAVQVRLLDSAGAPLKGVAFEDGRTLHPVTTLTPEADPPYEPGARCPHAAAYLNPVPASETPLTPTAFAGALRASMMGMGDAALGWLDFDTLAVDADASLTPQEQAALLAWQGHLATRRTPLPEATRRSLARRAWEVALALDPECLPAHAGLGGIAAARGAMQEADASFRAAVEANPGCLQALLERLKLAVAESWRTEAVAVRDAIVALAPESLAAHLARAGVAHHLRRLDEAAPAEAALLAFQPRDDGQRWQAAHAFLFAGDAEQAVSVLEEGLSDRPDAIRLLRHLGDLHLRMEQPERAEAVLRRAVGLVPRDEGLHRRLGDALSALERPEEAVQAYEKSLALVPGQPELRRLVCELTDREFAFWKPYILDGTETLQAFRAERARPSGRTARIIDHSIVEVQPDGSFVSYTHDLVQILNPSGIQDAANIQIRGEILRARTIQPNGQTMVPTYLPDQQTLTMPALSVGAATEHVYLWYQPAPFDLSARIPTWYFRSPSSEETFLLSLYMIRVPHGVPFVFEGRNLDEGIEYERRETRDATVHIWTARDMPRAVHEDGSPNIDARLPFVDAGGARDWTHINQLFLGGLTGSLRLSDAIRAEAGDWRDALAPGVTEAEAKRQTVARIHRFVLDTVQPSNVNAPAAHILRQRYGRRAVLLLAMLDAAGIPAWYAPTRPPAPILHEPNWTIPKMEQFPISLVVAEVEGEKIWLDTRFRHLTPGTLVEDVAGGTALRIDREGGRFLDVPPMSPDAFRRDFSATITLDDPRDDAPAQGGRLRDGHLSLRGKEGEEGKETLTHATPLMRHVQLEGMLAAFLPGVQLEGDFKAEAAPGALAYTFEATLPFLTEERKGGRFATRMRLPEPAWLPSDDQALEDRRTPFLLDTYLVHRDRVRYGLPEGYVGVELPAPLRLRTPFGSYQLTVRQEGGAILVERDLMFRPQVVSLEAWPDYIGMIRTIERAEREAFLWELRDGAATKTP